MGFIGKLKSLFGNNEVENEEEIKSSNQAGWKEDIEDMIKKIKGLMQRGDPSSIQEALILNEELDRKLKEIEASGAAYEDEKREMEEYLEKFERDREELIKEAERLDSEINENNAKIKQISEQVENLPGSKKMHSMILDSVAELEKRAELLKAQQEKDEYPQIMEELIM